MVERRPFCVVKIATTGKRACRHSSDILVRLPTTMVVIVTVHPGNPGLCVERMWRACHSSPGREHKLAFKLLSAMQTNWSGEQTTLN